MAVSKFTQEQADKVLKWWEATGLEMVAEHGLDAGIPKSGDARGVFPSQFQEQHFSLGFEFVAGVPAITRRFDGGDGVKGAIHSLVGDAEGSVFKEDFALAGNAMNADDELRVLSVAMENWDAIRYSYELDVMDRWKGLRNTEKFSDTIVREFRTDGPFMDGGTYYGVSRFLTRKERDDIRGMVFDAVERMNMERFEGGGVNRDEVLREMALDRKRMESMFSDWFFLSGHMDWRTHGVGAYKGVIVQEDLESVARWARQNPEYAPYQDEIAGWLKEAKKTFGVRTTRTKKNENKVEAGQAAPRKDSRKVKGGPVL